MSHNLNVVMKDHLRISGFVIMQEELAIMKLFKDTIPNLTPVTGQSVGIHVTAIRVKNEVS